MKKLFFILVAVGALVLASLSWEANASSATKKQQALTRFDKAVSVHGVVLTPGQYLFVHDDAAMMRGDACTYIYKGDAQDKNKLVV
jgi:predicted metal-dependent enzyme (double-stranded beta helix superfamily)